MPQFSGVFNNSRGAVTVGQCGRSSLSALPIQSQWIQLNLSKKNRQLREKVRGYQLSQGLCSKGFIKLLKASLGAIPTTKSLRIPWLGSEPRLSSSQIRLLSTGSWSKWKVKFQKFKIIYWPLKLGAASQWAKWTTHQNGTGFKHITKHKQL